MLKGTQAHREEQSPLPSASLCSSALLAQADREQLAKEANGPNHKAESRRAGRELSDHG